MEHKTKVAFYVNMFLMGGIETSLINYLNELPSQKYDVTLLIGIYMGDKQIFINELKPHIKVQYIIKNQFLCKFYQSKHQKKISLINKIIFNTAIKPFCQLQSKQSIISLTKQFDVIVDYALELLSIAPKVSLHSKLIGFFHFSLEQYYANNKHKMLELRSNLGYYKHIVVLNKHMLDELKNILPEFTSKASIIYNQLNIDTIKAKSMMTPIECDYILESNYIVSVGRLEESQKDFTTLIKAYALLHKKLSANTPNLLIVGDGSDANKLKALVHSLKLEQNIIFTGQTSNPYPFIKNSRLLILSSKFEGLAMVLVEAMALSTPVIATDCPTGSKDALLNGSCGKLVAIGNKIMLADAIAEILSNRGNICQKFISNGALRIKDFDIKINIVKLEKLLMS